jgi:hypothetical protein
LAFRIYITDGLAQQHLLSRFRPRPVGTKQNFLFTDHYIFSPAWTNEFRFSYARQEADTQRISPQSVPAAMMLPLIQIPSINSPGVPSLLLQFRKTNNLLFQETQTKLSGRHTFRGWSS